MSPATRDIPPFTIKDCALIQIATGVRAQNVRELRDRLLSVPAACIDYHFWGGLLRPRFDDPEYNNDFAAWARHGLHDYRLAERLAVIDPAEFADIESLRRELVDIIESRIEEGEYGSWAKPDEQFQFIRSQLVVFDTGRLLAHPRDLPQALPSLSVGSVYYHFVDARRRPPLRVDDFRAWFAGYQDEFKDLGDTFAEVDPYFGTLIELREELARLAREVFACRSQ